MSIKVVESIEFSYNIMIGGIGDPLQLTFGGMGRGG